MNEMTDSVRYYRIGDVVLKSGPELSSFAPFLTGPCEADATLTVSEEEPGAGPDISCGRFLCRRVSDGWFFHSPEQEQSGLITDAEYTCLRLARRNSGTSGKGASDTETERLIRLALECLLIRRGFVSLHAAAVALNGEAYAFSGLSGMGKSTRARAWQEAFGAELISGDRPLIKADTGELYGVPWDGKEQCFRNVHFPLKVIIDVRRSQQADIRRLGAAKSRRFLMRQSFVPMWDAETAAVQMGNIVKLIRGVKVVRGFCGPDSADAEQFRQLLELGEYQEAEPDIQARLGYALRKSGDHYILMSADKKCGDPQGFIQMDEASAYTWSMLHNPSSRQDLIQALQGYFHFDRPTAEEKLARIISEFDKAGLITVE